MTTALTRRVALAGAIGGSGLLLGSCSRIVRGDSLTANADFQHILGYGETWTQATQRFLLSGGQLAPEFEPSDISAHFKSNGTFNPDTPEYNQALAEGFANWRLRIDGLVARPMSLSLAELRRLPARTQITRHDCVEGWSAIAQWTGTPLGLLLKAAGMSPRAKYAVFYCADNLGAEPLKGGMELPGRYYESLGLDDLFHPQTLIAYAMNGRPLTVPYGAPLRLRVERMLGYKHAKYLQRIQLVDSLAPIEGGKGGYWEDRGYEWYARI
jgi:DMSO/TMAO reductase YedYZ molybdopterin-dependent catalytic subunit